jgi:hypothetical protein
MCTNQKYTWLGWLVNHHKRDVRAYITCYIQLNTRGDELFEVKKMYIVCFGGDSVHGMLVLRKGTAVLMTKSLRGHKKEIATNTLTHTHGAVHGRWTAID